MKFINSRKPLVASMLLTMGIAAVPSIVQATNGYFLIGFGSESRSMGGTGVADSRGGLAAAFNPATMIDSGNQFQLGADIFVPPRAIYHEGGGALGFTNERSNHDIFLVPSMGGTYKYSDNMTLGFAFIGAGLKTEYDQTTNSSSCAQERSQKIANGGICPPTVFNSLNSTAASEAGVELIQMQFLPSIAFKLSKTHTVGATFVLAAQFFRAEGLEDFDVLGFTGSPGQLTGEGFEHSYGGGYRLGWLGKYNDDTVRVGANYSSRVWMGPFQRYENLFAEKGDFDIPENYAIGLAVDFTPSLTVSFDFQRILWSDVRSVGNPGPDASNPSSFFSLCENLPSTDSCKLGGVNGLGFGWVDRNVYKLGVNWAFNEKWDLRAGWNYSKTPILDDQVLFNMLAPATPEHHLTLGAGYDFNESWKVDMSFVYAFTNTVSGPTAFGNGGAIVEGTNASIAMKQYSLGAVVGYRF